MLKRWFNNPDGALYEATEVDFTTANALYPHADGTPRDDIPLYELKSKVDDRSLLYSLARALTMPSPDQAMAAAASYLNIDQFINFWAVTAIIGNFDVMPYSMPGDDYFVYANPDDKKIYLLPWGIDETFEAGDTDVVRTVYSVLARTCAASPACLQQFVESGVGHHGQAGCHELARGARPDRRSRSRRTRERIGARATPTPRCSSSRRT